MPYYFG